MHKLSSGEAVERDNRNENVEKSSVCLSWARPISQSHVIICCKRLLDANRTFSELVKWTKMELSCETHSNHSGRN